VQTNIRLPIFARAESPLRSVKFFPVGLIISAELLHCKMRVPSIDLSQPTTAKTYPGKERALFMSCVAHVLHDGYTDLIYVMLPIWQTQFGIGYAWLAVIRALYLGSLAGLQLPSNRLAERLGDKVTLVLGTATAAIGYGLAGLSGSLFGLGLALTIAGAGSSTQHPIGSGIVSRFYDHSARGPLGVYNFAGDLGKAALPSITSLLLIVFSWHQALWGVSGLGLIAAISIAVLMPNVARKSFSRTENPAPPAGSTGFALLTIIGVLDTGVRMGLLIFLPFILKGKGASLPEIGVALALVFVGGAAGKFICGWLGARLGVLWSVVLTEIGTAGAIIVLLFLPLLVTWIMLPLLGALLNGTSSVLYGTVPEIVPPGQTERAFALFYTAVIGSGALSPILYGFLGDHVGIYLATTATATTALLILPLAFALGFQQKFRQ
jgi:MFS transporter, FSR family, fosmidomycin resistance protein